MVIILSIIACISSIVAIVSITYNARHKNEIEQYNLKVRHENEVQETINTELFKKGTELSKACEEYEKHFVYLSKEKDELSNNISQLSVQLANMEADAASNLQSKQKLSTLAFESYCDNLEASYKEKQLEYNQLVDKMGNSYQQLQQNLIREIELVEKELKDIKATRQALIEAQRREKELEGDLSFYCLSITESEKGDIAKLESVKYSLSNPRILSMLIWQTYFQKPLKTLSANVLGAGEVMGIYKITNTSTKECYIGQAVDIAKRWAEHCKCGCGIDTPASNKLYKSMKEFGLWSFSFELLEKCSKEQLNEKEKYYIDLYDSYNFGFNSTIGNK